MTTTIFCDEFDYLLSIQSKEPWYKLSSTAKYESPLCTYVSEPTEANPMASWISFFLFHKPEDLLSESVSSALSKLAIQLDELPDTNVCLYKALGPTSLKDAERLSTNSSFVVSVAISPQPTLEAEVDLNAWYEEEHISLLSQVPGWQACRRFSLIDIKSTVNSAPPPRYLALHAYKHLDGFTTPQFKAAANTPWRTRVMKSIVARERHVYRLADE